MGPLPWPHYPEYPEVKEESIWGMRVPPLSHYLKYQYMRLRKRVAGAWVLWEATRLFTCPPAEFWHVGCNKPEQIHC